MASISRQIAVVFSDETAAQQRRFLAWWPYDPLILADANVAVDIVTATDGLRIPDTADLAVLPTGLDVSADETQRILADHLADGGSVFLQHPTVDGDLTAQTRDFAADVLSLDVIGRAALTAPTSLTTRHEATRVKGKPTGTSVYPHREKEGHLQFGSNADILTQLGVSGDPDLIINETGNVAAFATPVLRDLAAHHRMDADYFEYRQTIGLLFVNATRRLLGLDPITQPVTDKQTEWAHRFYGYAAAKDYVTTASAIKDRPFEDASQSARHIQAAASVLVNGEFDECEEQFEAAMAPLSNHISDILDVDQYLFRGLHASLLTDEYHRGGLLGYAECEWMDHLMESLRRHYEWLETSDTRSVDDLSGRTWEIIAEYYPEVVHETKEVLGSGHLELGRGLYSQPYLPILSAAANIRQFEFGLTALEEAFDERPDIYFSPRDHFDFHPQMPQLLDEFGYNAAILHTGVIGEVKSFSKERIGWEGLDGTTIEAVPEYEGVNGARSAKDLFNSYWWPRPDVSVSADEHGYEEVLFGDSLDATSYTPGEREANIVNPSLNSGEKPISGTWVTGGEFIEQTSSADESHYLDVDDLYGRNLERWTSFGCLNEAYRIHRESEKRLLAAETFLSLSLLYDQTTERDINSELERLQEGWKDLLAAEDHMVFGATDYAAYDHDVDIDSYDPVELKHHHGYHQDPLPAEFETLGWMDNYGEAGSDHYAGPKTPVSRYETFNNWTSNSYELGDTVLQRAVASLSDLIDTRPPSDDCISFVVFNRLAHKRTGIVSKTIELPADEFDEFDIKDASGSSVDYQITSTEHDPDTDVRTENLLVPVSAPGLGYQVYHIVSEGVTEAPTETEPANDRLKTRYYDIRIDTDRGVIGRIYDRELEEDVFDAATDGRFLGEIFSVEDPAVSSTEMEPTVQITDEGPVATTVTIESAIADCPYTLEITAYETEKRIELALEIDYGNGTEFGEHESVGTGLRLAIPMRDIGEYAIRQPFGIYRTSQTKQYTLDAVSVERENVSLVAVQEGCPGIDTSGGVFSFTLAQGHPLATGQRRYQVSLTTGPEDMDYISILRQAKDCTNSFIVHDVDVHNGRLGPTKLLLRISSDNDSVDLVTMDPGVDTVTASVCEIDGNSTNVTFDLDTEADWSRIGLSGEPLAAEEHRQTNLEQPIEGHEITAVRIKYE